MRRFLLSVSLLALACGNAWAPPVVSIWNCTGVAATDTPGLNGLLASTVTAQPGGGGIVRFHGFCPINASVIAQGNVTLTGDGANNSALLPVSSSFDAVFYNPPGTSQTQAVNPLVNSPGLTTNAKAIFADFTIQYPPLTSVPVPAIPYVPYTGVYAIRMQSQSNATGATAPTALTQPDIHGIEIYNAPAGIYTRDAGATIYNVRVMNFAVEGIHLGYLNYPDGGGGKIHHNAITNYLNATSVCPLLGRGLIVDVSGKIDHNDFACLFDGILANLGPSSQLGIADNSFDTMGNTGAWIQRQNTSVTFQHFSFTGNKCGAYCLYFRTDGVGSGLGATVWMQGVIVANNEVQGGCAFYLDGINTLAVVGNTLLSATCGVNIGPNSTNVLVGPNVHGGSPYPANILQPPASQVTYIPGR